MVALRASGALLVAAALLIAVHQATAFSAGGPNCMEPCPSMGPDGGPSASPNPFSTMFIDDNATPPGPVFRLAAGSMYTYMLATTGSTPMEGFMVDARDFAMEGSPGGSQPAGEFDAASGPFKPVTDCAHAVNSAYTHDGPFSSTGGVGGAAQLAYLAPAVIPSHSAGIPFTVLFHTIAVEDGGRWWQEDVMVEVGCMQDSDCEQVDCKIAKCMIDASGSTTNVCSYESDMEMDQQRCSSESAPSGFCSAGACMTCGSDVDCDTGSSCRSSVCDVPSGACMDTLLKAENDSCGPDDEVCTDTGDCVHCFTAPTPFTLCDASCGGGMSYSYRAKEDHSPVGCDAGMPLVDEMPCNEGACDGSECDRTGLHYLEGDPGTDTDDQVVSSQCHHADPSMCAWPLVMAGVPYWPVNSPGEGMVSNGEMDSCASGL